MTYRNHKKCSLICNLTKLIRRMRWAMISQPATWSLDTVKNGSAIHRHFGNNY